MTWERLIEKMHKIRNDWSVIDWLYHVFYFVKEKITNLEDRCTVLEARCTALEQKVVEIFQTLTSHEERITSVENTQDEQADEIKSLSESLGMPVYKVSSVCENSYVKGNTILNYSVNYNSPYKTFFIMLSYVMFIDNVAYYSTSLLCFTNGRYGSARYFSVATLAQDTASSDVTGMLFGNKYVSTQNNMETYNLYLNSTEMDSIQIEDCFCFGPVSFGTDVIINN